MDTNYMMTFVSLH